MENNKEWLQLLVDNTPFLIGIHQDSKVVYINKAGLELFGAKNTEDIIGKHIKNLVPSDLWDISVDFTKRMLKGEKGLYPREDKYLRLDGSIVDVEITAVPLTYKGKPAIQIMAFDLTEKNKIKKELKKAENEFEVIFNGIPHPIAIMDSRHNIVKVNKSLEKKINKSSSEILNMKCWEIFHWADITSPPESCPFEKMLLSKGIETMDMEMEALGGYYTVYCTPIYDDNENLDKTVHIAIDIIERKKSEDKIKYLLNEKEILLKEVQHRITNTLNTVSSLLNIKSLDMQDNISIQAFQDMSKRIHTMGMVYRNLVQTDDYKFISIEGYLSPLIDNIISIFPNSKNLTIEKRIENFSVDSKIATSIGLIANEIITNSFKYAFPGNTDGTISINLSQSNGMINMEIFDDGVGISEINKNNKRTGLGMKLINSLTQQLCGEMKLKGEKGTGYIFKIPNKTE
jgi:PAS domain S-box-containing protein